MGGHTAQQVLMVVGDIFPDGKCFETRQPFTFMPMEQGARSCSQSKGHYSNAGQ